MVLQLAGLLALGIALPPPASRTAVGTASSFTKLVPGLPEQMHTTLASRGISAPTPIQQAAIPRALTGESMLLHAETGSGKSLAFLLPALARLDGLDGAEHKVLVVAPTRELAVQLANEAAGLLPGDDAVQIVAIGCEPSPAALLGASVICCTAAEFMALGVAGGPFAGVVERVLADVKVLVLDELDSLLPIRNVYGARADQKKKAENKKYEEPPAQARRRRRRRRLQQQQQPAARAAAAAAPPTAPHRTPRPRHAHGHALRPRLLPL